MESQVRVYSQGMKARDMWKDVFGRFRKENSAMNATDFYAGDRISLFINLRSMKNNELHCSGLRLVDTKKGVQLNSNEQESTRFRKCEM